VGGQPIVMAAIVTVAALHGERERRERGVRKERLIFFPNLVCSKSDFPEFEHFG
jgi:hypothetical protein